METGWTRHILFTGKSGSEPPAHQDVPVRPPLGHEDLAGRTPRHGALHLCGRWSGVGILPGNMLGGGKAIRSTVLELRGPRQGVQADISNSHPGTMGRHGISYRSERGRGPGVPKKVGEDQGTNPGIGEDRAESKGNQSEIVARQPRQSHQVFQGS